MKYEKQSFDKTCAEIDKKKKKKNKSESVGLYKKKYHMYICVI